MFKKKVIAQASFEYLMILAIVLAMLVPGLYLFYARSNSTSVQLSVEQLGAIGNEIIQNVEYIYPFGTGSRTSISFTMPIGVSNMSVRGDPTSATGTEFVLNLSVNNVNVSLVYFSKYPLFIGNCTNSMPLPQAFIQNPGKKTLYITSCGNNISVYSS